MEESLNVSWSSLASQEILNLVWDLEEANKAYRAWEGLEKDIYQQT